MSSFILIHFEYRGRSFLMTSRHLYISRLPEIDYWEVLDTSTSLDGVDVSAGQVPSGRDL